MQFTIMVNIEVEREEGKFATRDELLDQIIEAIESADPGSLDGDNGGVYSVTQWEAEEHVAAKVSRKKS